MDEAETQQRHTKACGIEAFCMCKELKAASSMEHNNADQFSMIFGAEQAAVEKRTDMLYQSCVVLNAG